MILIPVTMFNLHSHSGGRVGMPGGISGQLHGSSLALDARLAGRLGLGLGRLNDFLRLSRNTQKKKQEDCFHGWHGLLCSSAKQFLLLFDSASLSPSQSFY